VDPAPSGGTSPTASAPVAARGIGNPEDPVFRPGIELFGAEVLPVPRRELPDRLWDYRPPEPGADVAT
jgi:hypothetical protein